MVLKSLRKRRHLQDLGDHRNAYRKWQKLKAEMENQGQISDKQSEMYVMAMAMRACKYLVSEQFSAIHLDTSPLFSA